MKKISLFLLLITLYFSGCTSQKIKKNKPKLVVGIVVDQMRYDYLTRYYDRYSEKGFKRLLNDGFALENGHFNYIPTYTAVGHSSIFTGTTPDHHGIISNNWYDKFLKKNIYCVSDDNYTSVGTNTSEGKKSPYRLQTSTISDQILLGQNMRGKAIGIALKDRSAILPVGHTANAAYWFEGKSGHFISSSYYLDSLPNWVQNFNKKEKAKDYISKPWNTLYDINSYKNSMVDDNAYEGLFTGESKPVFPHDLPNLMSKNGGLDIIKGTPFGNSITLDFAKEAIIAENLGKNNDVDFLSISFSSTDYVGHKYGIDAIETEDTYLRLDKDIANLLDFLDEKIGKDQYTLFLTADHGAVRVPSYLQALKIPAGYINTRAFKDFINQITKKYFKSDDLIEQISNYQIFLDQEKVEGLGFDKNTVAQKIAEEVVKFESIYKAVTAKTMQTTNFTKGVLSNLQNGYNQKLSGDVLMIPNIATISGRRTGTTHGSGFSYDTHVPIIFYGNGIQKGVSKKYYEIIDIAPTITNLLKVEAPNASTGKIIEEVFKN